MQGAILSKNPPNIIKSVAIFVLDYEVFILYCMNWDALKWF